MDYETYDNILTILVVLLTLRIPYLALAKKMVKPLDALLVLVLFIMWWI